MPADGKRKKPLGSDDDNDERSRRIKKPSKEEKNKSEKPVKRKSGGNTLRPKSARIQQKASNIKAARDFQTILLVNSVHESEDKILDIFKKKEEDEKLFKQEKYEETKKKLLSRKGARFKKSEPSSDSHKITKSKSVENKNESKKRITRRGPKADEVDSSEDADNDLKKFVFKKNKDSQSDEEKSVLKKNTDTKKLTESKRGKLTKNVREKPKEEKNDGVPSEKRALRDRRKPPVKNNLEFEQKVVEEVEKKRGRKKSAVPISVEEPADKKLEIKRGLKKRSQTNEKTSDNESEDLSTKPKRAYNRKKVKETSSNQEKKKNDDNPSDDGMMIELSTPGSMHPQNTSKPKIDRTKYFEDSVMQKYGEAIEKLQEYSRPDSIPCREEEKNTIYKFLMNGIENQGSSHSLYISGIPGIGKTASFLEVIQKIQKERPKNESIFIHLNAMNLNSPENAYLMILKELTGITSVNKYNACLILNDIFKTGKLPQKYNKQDGSNLKKIKIILLDELDYLLTKDQNLLYNLFDWPHQKYSKLIIIGIANTMDFPERLLHKIASRIGDQRIVYKPYNNHQIAQIIKDRLEGTDIFLPESIIYVSKKVATFSSDIRRTLNVCRKALEICQEEYQENKKKGTSDGKLIKVKIEDIRKSYDLLYSSPYHLCLNSFSGPQILVLLALALEIKLRGENVGLLSDVYERIRAMAVNLGWKEAPTLMEIKELVSQLCSINLLSIKEKALLKRDGKKEDPLNPNKKKHSNMMDIQISLYLTLDDLTNSLKENEIFLKFKTYF